ncbi:MAG TPA: ATP-dependent RNA helicase HrpA [Yinghuangia sp.]|nr:ATP-dependent RNA helicase HrpA [Yinghuangia sp.]
MDTAPSPAPLADLRARLSGVTLRDERRLARRIDGASRVRGGEKRAAIAAELAAEVEKAEFRAALRRESRPEISYPEQLPVAQKKDDILAAIRDHQVVIVAGETGSGKTTQLPKICLELGRGVRGLVGHTQPRRLAARTVADRIAEELKTPLGSTVGYKVRFNDRVSDESMVKLMTDGILLAELTSDRDLLQYDTLIIDEAHERSLNIDFILGYLKQLLPRRPDLKVVITSATIDPERFSRHFGDAPIIEVSGRTYPVEVRYRPLVADDAHEDGGGDRDQVQGIIDAVEELQREGPGDVLVFLSGEREIRDTAEALTKRNLPHTEILPLYARLSSAEQHRVFQSHSGRRVVLATNVAETSLTVPGIKYVVDPGTARISRYSHRTKVQRLPIEAVSQASANQRKGRCGRTSDGICIRLYSEEDFVSRPEFTDAEILRTNLASVILQMTAIGLGDIAAFPFIDPPDRRNIKDGVDLLHELGAIDPEQQDVRKRLTPIGRQLAQLPVDPRMARMVLEADRNNCVREVMVIAAALSIQDPRERPADKKEQAQQLHARFVDKEAGSDFLTYLKLWDYLQEQQKERSSSGFRRMCKQEFLNYLRIREWQDVYSQLRQTVRQMGLNPGTDADDRPADPQRIHSSILVGLLSHVGLYDAAKREYGGARGTRFAIFPGSSLFKKSPRWVMSAELVETTRLWARVNARIEPEWIEPLAGHLVKRNYSEPHWEQRAGAVMAYERVTLYGVPIVAQRKVNYGRIDPELSRELFIRHALVEGDWRTHHAFLKENRALLEEVEELEHRARRRDILVDDETLFDFYDQRIGQEVVSGRHFDTWWKKARQKQPDLLSFEKSMLINERAGGIDESDYPDFWTQGDLRLPLTYQFEPGNAADGVTVHIPLAVLGQVVRDGFDWQIRGLREELVTELIRSLPKSLRRNFIPAPDVARAALAKMTPRQEPLVQALGRELQRLKAVPVPPESWDLDRIPDHLRITFRVEDDRGRPLAEGKDLAELKLRLKSRSQATLSRAADTVERGGLTAWGDLGTLRRTFESTRDGHPVKGYPALVDEGSSVAVRVFETEAEQQAAMWQGTRRLLILGVNSPVKSISGRLPNRAKLALSHNPHNDTADMFDDCVRCAVDKILSDAGGPAWDAEGFAKLLDKVRAELPATTEDTVVKVERILTVHHALEVKLKGTTSLALVPALTDIRSQLAALVHRGFITETGWRRLPDVLRYLRGIERRLAKLPGDPHGDRHRMLKVADLEEAYARRLAAQPAGRPVPDELRQVRWMLEELRVSYFAQSLGTPYPVSDKRILKALES